MLCENCKTAEWRLGCRSGVSGAATVIVISVRGQLRNHADGTRSPAGIVRLKSIVHEPLF
jgi:hypothetical protein